MIFRLPRALQVALAARALSLALPHTFFQPDEFYQAFEPAHAFVFGHGYLTWEWRDLPLPRGGTDAWWTRVVVGGRLRGWIWPGVFVLAYKLVEALGLASSDMIVSPLAVAHFTKPQVIAPRMIGVLLAALTDYYTSLLAAKVLGSGYTSGAVGAIEAGPLTDELFLSLTSLFNAHLLSRALSTSPETLLTTMALYYYPLPSFRDSQLTTPGDTSATTSTAAGADGKKLTSQPTTGDDNVRTTCGAMDRAEGRDTG